MSSKISKRFYVKTHGCQMNEYDSARMADLLREQADMLPADTEEQADLLVLNTCSVRARPQERVFHQLGRWRKLKDNRPDTLIAVGGCVASLEGASLGERAPFVDVIFGPQTLHRLPALLDEAKQRNHPQGHDSDPAPYRSLKKKPIVDISFPEIEKFDCLPAPHAEGCKAYVSIMEGCSRYCSFCVVPYTRGEEISRPFDSIIKEVRSLAAQGVREVTLLGQNVNAYNDRSNKQYYELADVIYAIAEIKNIGRIRFTTSHPLMFGQSLIDCYADVKKLAKHLHLPVQSGSDRVLAAMKRGYTALEYKYKIHQLRLSQGDISVSSDFIIGFPGESKQDFQDTLSLIDDIQFDQSYSFLYSPRPGTPAAGLQDDVDQQEKEQRLQIIQKKLDQNKATISNTMLNSTQTVLVEGLANKTLGCAQGRTENNRTVVFPHTDPEKLIGSFIPIHIDEATPHCLRGSCV